MGGIFSPLERGNYAQYGNKIAIRKSLLNPKHEIPAFAPQGGTTRRQAKFKTISNVPNTKIETFSDFDI